MRPTLLSLFAGAGGLDIGLERAGFATLAINEIEPHACETLRQNKELSSLGMEKFDHWFGQRLLQRCYEGADPKVASRMRARLRSAPGGHELLRQAAVVEGDIRNLSSEHLMSAAGVGRGDLTLVAGGPPCQPFSRAGKRETVETEDGRLFLEFVRVVNDTRPRWFLFENVKGLAQSKTLVPYSACSACGRESVVPFEMRASVFDGPLTQIRCATCNKPADVFIREIRGGSLEIILDEFSRIGYRCQHRLLNAADFGVPQNRERLFIVGSRDSEHFEWPEATYGDIAAHPAGQMTLEGLESRLLPKRSVKDVLWKSGHPDFGPLDPSRAVLWVKNVVRPHAEPVTWTLDRQSPTIGAHQAAKLALAPYGVCDAQLARQQWHTKGRRQKDLPAVHVEHEYLSDAELLTLQTFPADWYLHGTRMQRAFQIGNAVPPDLAAAVGGAICRACDPRRMTKSRTAGAPS
jgi:DNA (cytosine-5)-methyltransferase 1